MKSDNSYKNCTLDNILMVELSENPKGGITFNTYVGDNILADFMFF